MKKIFSCIFVVLIVFCQAFCLSGCGKKDQFTDYSFDYFDTATTIIGFEKNEETFKANCVKIKAQLEEYHKLYNIYNTYEGMNNLCVINQTEGGSHKSVVVDRKIIDLLVFSTEMHDLTDGYVNIAMGKLLSIWHKYRNEGINDPANAKIPEMSDLYEAIEHSGINTVSIDFSDKTVYIADSEVSLDVGAIAKGYAVEQVAKWMENNKMNGYLLNVGGNVRAVGKRYDGKEWTIGIENPDRTSSDAYVETLKIEDMAVVTSGVYQRYYTVDDINYHHIIDNDTLMPAVGYKSVSVVAPDSGLADALSTALMCVDVEKGKIMISQKSNVEAMWVLDNGEIVYSENFKKYITN